MYFYLKRNHYFSAQNQYFLYVDTRIFYPYKLSDVAENLSVMYLRIIFQRFSNIVFSPKKVREFSCL